MPPKKKKELPSMEFWSTRAKQSFLINQVFETDEEARQYTGKSTSKAGDPIPELSPLGAPEMRKNMYNRWVQDYKKIKIRFSPIKFLDKHGPAESVFIIKPEYLIEGTEEFGPKNWKVILDFLNGRVADPNSSITLRKEHNLRRSAGNRVAAQMMKEVEGLKQESEEKDKYIQELEEKLAKQG